MRRRVECPMCKRPPEVASITAYLYVHYCTVSESVWYTNGLLWSNTQTEVNRVERARLVHPAGKASEDRQVPCEVIPLVEKHQRKDRPNSA